MQEIANKKRMHGKSIWAFLLCSAFLFSLMPITALAEQEINAVDVSDIAMPAAGETPDYEGTLPQDANYHFATEDELRDLGWTDLEIQGLENGVCWRTSKYDLLSSSDRFEAGKEYFYMIALLPNTGYSLSNTTSVTLNGSTDIVFSASMEKGALLVNSSDLKATGQASVTMEIPIRKVIFQNGKNAPGANTFTFEVEPYGNPQADISSLTITGTTINTDGDGTFDGTLTIVGDPTVIDNAQGLKITEKNEGAEHWYYDGYSCVVYRDTGNGMLIQKEHYASFETVQAAVFYNAHVDNVMTIEIPFSKTVTGTGTTAPGTNTFEFTVESLDPTADMSGITITGTTIDTDGVGTYTGTIKIVGDAEAIENVGSFTITEKNAGAANWTYDDTAYRVSIQLWWIDGIPDLRSVLFAKDMGPNTMPQEVQNITFTNTYNAPVSTDVTIEMPIRTTIKQGGNTAPGFKTFEFAVEAYGNPAADLSSLVITGATIATDGVGNYTGVLKIVGDPTVIDNARGLKLTQKNDGATDWSFDTATYVVYRDTGNGLLIQKDLGGNLNPQSVQSAEFINTYTKNSTPTTDSSKPGNTTKNATVRPYIPNTSDDSNLFLWFACLFVSCSGLIVISLLGKRYVVRK